MQSDSEQAAGDQAAHERHSLPPSIETRR
jgi:hypothetical protein